MSKYFLLFYILLCFLATSCNSQKKIFYTYERNVNDSLFTGINELNKSYEGSTNPLKFYATVGDDSGVIQIVLNDYFQLPPSGFRDLIKRTNRFIRVNQYRIPVIYMSDSKSDLVKRDHIQSLPLGGYFVQFDYQNNVLKTGVFF